MMQLRLNNFLQTTDFHGFKYLSRDDYSKQRKLLWGGVIFAAFAGFAAYTVFRIQYYLTYPSAVIIEIDAEDIPVPGLMICPAQTFDLLDSEQNVGDNHSLHQESLDMLDNLFRMNVTFGNKTNIYGVCLVDDGIEDILNLATNYSIVSKHFDGNLGDNFMSGILAPSYVNCHGIKSEEGNGRYLVRELLLNKRMVWSYKTEFMQFISKFGIKKSLVKTCKLYYEEFQYVDCFNSLHEVLTDSGLCLKLDGIWGKKSLEILQYTFPRTRKRKQKGLILSFHDTFVNVTAVRIYYFKHGLSPLISLYGDDILPMAKEISLSGMEKEKWDFYLTHSYVINHLELENCNPNDNYHQYECIHQCMIDTMNCSLFYFPVSLKKPLCHFYIQEAVFLHHATPALVEGALQSCQYHCPPSCAKVIYQMTAETKTYRTGGDNENKEITFQFKPASSLRQEKFTEILLYTWDSLLAELAGMFGLFAGASLLAICHLVHYLFMTFLKFVRDLKIV